MPNVDFTVFECTLQLRWSDEDSYQHVNNAKVLTLVEEARVRATRNWAKVDGAPAVVDPTQRRVIRSQNTTFDRPIFYGVDGTDSVVARVWVNRIGTTSFGLAHELYQNGKRCVYSECVMVVIDAASGSPTPLSQAQRQQLSPHLFTPSEG